MAFSWSESVASGASMDNEDVNEMKTNLDTVYTDLGITRGGCGSGAGWSDLPKSGGDPINSTTFQELRDVADYAQENSCPSYCDTNYGPNQTATRDSNQNPDYGADNNGLNSSEDTSNWVADDATEDGTVHGTNNGTYHVAQWFSYVSSNVGIDCGTNYQVDCCDCVSVL